MSLIPEKQPGGESQAAASPPRPKRRPAFPRAGWNAKAVAVQPSPSPATQEQGAPHHSSGAFDPSATIPPSLYFLHSSEGYGGGDPLPGNAGINNTHRKVVFDRTSEPGKKNKSKRSKLMALLAELVEEEEEELPDSGQSSKILQAKRFPRTGAMLDGQPLAFRPRDPQFFEPSSFGGDPFQIPSSAPARGSGGLTVFFAVACLCLLGLVAYLLLWPAESGGASSSRPLKRDTVVEPGPAPAVVTDRALQVAESALAALQNGEFEKAASLYKLARDSRTKLPGLDYQSALLALETRDYELASSLLRRCVEKNENVPESLYLRARMVAAEGDYASAAADFDKAARAEPFSARSYFFGAECLRRQGTPTAAQARFDQALLRRPSPAEMDLIHFRMHLMMIESGANTKFQEELGAHLALSSPSGDTLLAAAANEMNRSNYPAAAEYLRRSVLLLPRATLDMRLRDYFFRNHLERPEIAAVLDAIKTTSVIRPASNFRKAGLVDPACRSLAENDPAGWP